MHSKTRSLSRLPMPARLQPLALVALAAVLAAVLALPAAAQGADAYGDGGTEAGYDAGYSYFRNLRGAATLIQYDGEETEAELNQPVLAGDRLQVVPGSMVEVLLSDGNLLRVDGGSDLVFDRLALSPEGDDRVTELTLYEGNVQLVVFAESVGDEYPRVALPSATVYVDTPGSFRIAAERGDWAEVVARRGRAEVVSDAGSVLLRAGEELMLAGRRASFSDVREAGRYDDLERWAQRLDTQRLERPEVDSSLAYAAAPLADHGTWITVQHRRAWLPRVSAGWSPYRHGRWRHTPIGMTWISYEPWGWVPYHYGSWDHVPSYGWVWYPGTSFAPAWVYWYWGPTHVAWVPVGYYTHHYGRHYRYRPGFRFGVYGWAGGDWGFYNDWNWCATSYLGRRDQWRYVWEGRDWDRHARRNVVPRGLITTDTRGLGPEHWSDPDEAMRVLRTRPGADGRAGVTRTAGELPDVTPFVARRGDLPPDVERRVVLRDGEGAERLTGTPLRPQTLGDSRTTARRPGAADGSGAVAGHDDGRRRVMRPVEPADGVERQGTDRPAAERPATGVRTARPVGAERPEVARPDTARPESARPGSVRPGTVRPDSPRTVRPPAERPQSPGRAEPRAGREEGPSQRPRVIVRERPERQEDDEPPTAGRRQLDAGERQPAGVRPTRVPGERAPAREGSRGIESARPGPTSGVSAPAGRVRDSRPQRVTPRPSAGSDAAAPRVERTPSPRAPGGTVRPAVPQRGSGSTSTRPETRGTRPAPRVEREVTPSSDAMRRMVQGIRTARPSSPPPSTSSPRASAPDRRSTAARAPQRRDSGRSGGSTASSPSSSRSSRSGSSARSSSPSRSGGGRSATSRSGSSSRGDGGRKAVRRSNDDDNE